MKLLIRFAIIASILSSCKTTKPVQVKYKLPSQTQSVSWDNLRSPKIDSFKILNTGAVKVPLKGMLNKAKLPRNHGMNEYLWVDVYVYLVHHVDKGWYMIDSGLDRTFQKRGNIKGLVAGNYIVASRQASGQNIAAQLKREKKKINGIFFTHLHGDHTAGLPEIDARIPKYVGEGEHYIDIPFLYHPNHLNKRDTLFQLPWAHSVSIGPLEKVIDIFGDNSIFAISTPGHSRGHVSYLINSDEGLILLTGDASHTKYGFEHKIEPGWLDDQQAAEKSLSQLIAFKKQYPKARVIYGHQQ